MWKEFFEKLSELRTTGESFVVATVVKVSGSTYRRPGARVLITQEGTATGLISGGCFESDLLERARQTIKTGRPVTVTFDTTAPDDLIFGLGLGCTGVAQILLEPFRGSENQKHLDFIAQSVNNGRPAVLVTVFRASDIPGVSVSSRMMIFGDRMETENLSDPQVVSLLEAESRSAMTSGASRVISTKLEQGVCESLVEVIALPTRLFVLGAGPDAVPLTRFAKQLGWQVTVVDRRPALVRADRFPAADHVLLCEPADLLQQIAIDEDSAAVVMTHHFETDLRYLMQLLQSPVKYIGLLGPKAKAELLLQKMKEEQFPITAGHLERIFGPVGLDIGSETPEEIALAIVAEIQTVQRGYSGGLLRNRTGPIHNRKDTQRGVI